MTPQQANPHGYRLASLALILVSCGGQVATPPPIVENAIGAAVSFDQSLLAYYTQPTRLSGGPYAGSLEVMPLPSGNAIALGQGVFDAAFGESVDTLFFFQQPTIDPTTNAYAGTLSLWTPRLRGPVTLSAGFAPRSVSTLDHSVLLFLDSPEPEQDATGDVKLVRTAECAGTRCPFQILGSAVMVTALRMSPDGRYAAYDTVTGTSADAARAVFLVSVADGTATQVTTPTIPAQVPFAPGLSSLSPDGSLLATLTMVNGVPLQLQVISTATGVAVPWSAPPGTMGQNVQFADAATLFIAAQDAAGTTGIYRTTATTATHVVDGTQFFLSYAPTGAERYLFFSTTASTALASNAPYDLQMLDLAAPSAPPIPLARATRSVPNVSNDLSTVWFLDPYDATTEGSSALIAASLPAGQPSTVASAGSFFGGANFCGSTNQLFYFGTPTGPSTLNGNGPAATLYEFREGTSRLVDPDALRWVGAANPATVYVTADNPLRIYREGLP